VVDRPNLVSLFSYHSRALKSNQNFGKRLVYESYPPILSVCSSPSHANYSKIYCGAGVTKIWNLQQNVQVMSQDNFAWQFSWLLECMRNPTTFCLAYDFFHTVWKLSEARKSYIRQFWRKLGKSSYGRLFALRLFHLV